MKSRFLFLLTFILAFLTFQSDEALACSCLERKSPTQAFRGADSVFVGTVSKISQHERFSDLKVAFLVDTPLKKISADRIDIGTSSQGSACGFPFEDGGQYLVFAYLTESKSLATGVCTRSRALRTGIIDDEVEILKSLANGRLEPRIYGTVYELTRGIYPLREGYWDSRRAMKGVTITAANMKHRFDAVSDEWGNFRIRDVPPGEYRLSFRVADGYKIGGDGWDESTEEERAHYRNLKVVVTPFDNPDALTIETRIDGRLSGTLRDRTGKAVGKDTAITLVSKATAAKEPGDIDYVHAYTDSKGRFEFFGIPPGEYYLGINIETRPSKLLPYRRTYFPSVSQFTNATVIRLARGEKLSGFTLQLPEKVPEIEVKGIVVDSAGIPIGGAIVERYGLYSSPWREEDGLAMEYIKQPTFEGRVVTDTNGGFVLKLLEGNRYRLNAFLQEKGSHRNVMEGNLDLDVSGPIKPVRLVLDRKGN